MQLCFFVEFKFQAFCGDLSMSLLWPRSCAVWGLCKEPHGCCSVPQTEHFGFHSPSVRHCKASQTSGVVIWREKSRMDVDVNPAGSPLAIFYHCTPEKISSGIEAIKWVIKLKQKLLAKSNVPGWGEARWVQAEQDQSSSNPCAVMCRGVMAP